MRRELPEGPITRRRRWGAALAGTLVLVFAFGAVVVAILATADDDQSTASTAIAFAAGLAPVSFAVLAIGSRNPRPVRGILIATPIALVLFVTVGALLREPATALVFGAGVAGAFALHVDPQVHRIPQRISFVSIASAVTLLFAFVAPGVAVTAAPLLPFPALVLADIVAESRAGASR